MTFMMKKKRFKFLVNLEVEELSSVPFVSGILFVKLRQLDGGTYMETSGREEVQDHRVKWSANFQFACKMTASATSGILEACMVRVSVRKEVKGGKSFQKLGFADVNLAEFAGAGAASRRYLLEGYDSKQRQDNSMLKLNIEMSIMSGDPCFKAPAPRSSNVPLAPSTEAGDLEPENKGGEDYSEDSIKSGSSGFGSLPRQRTSLVTSEKNARNSTVKNPPGITITAEQDLGMSDPEQRGSDCDRKESMTLELGHMRTGSHTSQQSKGSGYSSLGGTHSRQSSMGGQTALGHTRSPSTGSSRSDKLSLFGSIGRHKKLEQLSAIERRVDETRVDADELIDELINQTDFQIDEKAETSGLKLYVAKDGSTALSNQQMLQGLGGKYEQVVIDHSVMDPNR